MGYFDRAKALMKEAGSEIKAGIDGTKSVLGVKSLLETKPLTERYLFENNANCNARLASGCGLTTSESSGLIVL